MQQRRTPCLSSKMESDAKSRVIKATAVMVKSSFWSSIREGNVGSRVATSLVSFHIASNTKGLSTAWLGALVRLLARVAMTVDAKATWPRESLVAGRADVAVLRLGKLRLAGSADVMMVLPWVRTTLCRCWN